MVAILLTAALGLSPVPSSPNTGRLDSTAVEEVGAYPFGPGYAIALDSARQLAFVGSGAGVLVFDVSGPGDPVLLSDAIRGPGLVMDLCLSGQKLHVAYGSNSFNFTYPVAGDVEIWNVDNPAAPTLLGQADLPLTAFSVWANDTLMLASALHWLGAFDVSDPTHPVLIESLPALHTACQIRVRDTFAFAAMAFVGVQVYSIADRNRLGLVATWGQTGAFVGADLVGNRLYLANNSSHGVGAASGLWIYDISNPLAGQVLGVYDTSRVEEACRLAVRDTVAVMTYAYGADTKVLSVADPAAIHQLGTHPQTNGDVVWDGSTLLGAFERRFEKLGMSNPGHPVSLGHFVLDHAGSELVVDDGCVFTTRSNLSILSVSGPNGLERLGQAELESYPAGLSLADTVLAFIGSWPIRLNLLGVSNPASPNVLASESLGEGPGGASLVTKDTLCIVTALSEFMVFSIADPRNPVMLGSIPLEASGADLALRDSLVFAGSERLQIVNIARPAAPVVLLDTMLHAEAIELRDTFLYSVSWSSGWLSVYSVADPGEVRLLWGQHGFKTVLAIDDTLLAVSHRGSDPSGLAVFSIAKPAEPQWLGSAKVEDPPEALVLRGDTLFAGFGATGVRMYRLVRVPSGIEIEPIPGAKPVTRIWPVPVRNILYLAGRERATLFSATGRKVLELAPGANDVRHLAPGTYFARTARGKALAKVIIQH